MHNGEPLTEDAIPQPGDKRRELRPEDRRRVRPAPSHENDSYYFLLRL
jgi:hypothetical protein